MSKIWKRVFCSFLAAVMLFAVVPIQAFAADEESVVETTEVLETAEEVTEETEAPTDYFEEPTVATEEVIVAEEPEEEVWEVPFVDVVQEQAVRFLCSMEDLILAVYDSNGEFVRSDENDPTLYWLLPGIYCYEAACAGYETDSGEFEVFNEPLNVEVTLMAETAEEPTETTEETEPVPEETVEIIPEEVLAPAETEEEFEFGEIEYDEYTDELGRTISFEGMEVPDDFDPSLIATYGADVGYYVPVNSMDEAGDYVRSLMVDREEKIQFSYRGLNGGISSSNVKSILYDIIDEALKHTGSPIEGDYLRWHYKGMSISYTYSSRSISAIFTVSYYTTAEQENQMNGAVSNVLARLNLSGKSSYEKIQAIYQYVCTNIDYDYTNLGDSSYDLKYTAYAALVNKTAVCQGYASLMYRLLLASGVDARVIVGTGGGGGHAWNIANIDGLYYNLDATWDSSADDMTQYYSYFLKSPANFSDHYRNAEYDTSEFHATYPMASSDYKIEEHECVAETSPAKEPTCTEIGLTEGSHCRICGKTLVQQESVPALGHNYSIKGEIVASTCIEQGYTIYECSRCGEGKNSDFVDALGHDFSVEAQIVAPTCTEQGYTVYKCSRCDETENQNFVDAVGHAEELRNVKEATCTKPGFSGDIYCSACGLKLNEGTNTVALGHDLLDGKVIPPSCMSEGWTVYQCRRCDYSKKENMVYALGHSFTAKVSDKLASEATCTTPAIYYVQCDRCDAVNNKKTVPVGEAKPHSPGTPVRENEQGSTCTGKGSYDEVVYCVDCHTELSRNTVTGEILGHHFSVEVQTIKPTCTEQGYTTYKCSRCAENENRDFITALGHTKELRNVKDATCTAKGYTGDIYCSACNILLKPGEEIPALEHHLNHIEAKDATCTEAGNVEHWFCDTCGKAFADAKGTTDIANPVISSLGHKMTHTAAKAETCTEDGCKEFWTCEICKSSFEDTKGQVKIDNLNAWKLIPAHHTLKKVEAKKATIYSPGNIEHWICTECQKLFEDETAAGELTRDQVTIPKLVDKSTTLDLTGTELDGEPVVWIDGKEFAVTDNTVALPNKIAKVLTVYTYNAGSDDPHKVYPTGMKVYLLKSTDEGYTATPISELDNFLQYKGSSIRMTGKKGIRMITGVPAATRQKLIDSDIAGYHLEEYGTVLDFASEIHNKLTLETGKYNYAYRRGSADAIFSRSNGLIQYTNVLVGFSLNRCKEDIAMRPYAILKNESGETITIYGGIVYRSIGYIAWQNRDVYPKGSDGYNYIWEIINAVYGNNLPG